MSKLCEYENCKNIAYYANYYGKANRCKEHRENRQLQYTICMCGKSRSCFNYSTETLGVYCCKCKKNKYY